MTLEKERYERRAQETGTRLLPENDARLLQALETNDIVSYYDESASGERLLTSLAPIKTSQDCRECHSSKKTRGVIQLSTSLSAIDESLATSRKNSLLALIATIIVTALIAGQLLRRWARGPLEHLTGAMRNISQGDLEQSVKVVGQDEFGEMARIFNVMSTEIRMTHAGLRREQDKLTTIILGAEEGIIVTDGAGKVVLVNPAAERQLGKTAFHIIRAGFRELFDDAAEMDRWLRQNGTEPIVKLFNGRLFQVYVSTIQDASTAMIGTAALPRDVTEEKRLEEELRRLSTTDALTSLYNRRHMEYVLTTEHSRSARTKAPFAVLMLDIDHFKKFNDTYGHEQGDRVLQAVAKTFRDSLRKYDTACRYGGEEFIGILPQTNLDGGMAVAERLRSEVENLVVDGLKVTISIGVSAYPETGIESVDQLIHEADTALYR
ncbi:diguanylate cyclase [Aromatoleum toluclasticum]|uniref:GGDEF domain-containing protein n=1 Tax=Aromatoleum toluclasticum TaxID=92003 RepID=UPI001D194AC3|nr:diguanylate cyclase [Aromatoleum toluclasticum]MCC4117145.1 diguanylate cyclase [Aromatoleum toluclasticum]